MVEKNSGQWEVVGGKPSKIKSVKSVPVQNGKAKNGTAKKDSNSFNPQLIKVDELVSPYESQYAILDPELRAKSRKEALGIADKPAEKPKSKASAPTKEATKKKPVKDSGKEKEKQPKSLPDALKQINAAELGEAISIAKARFSGSPVLWLRDLSSYLNSRLNVEVDPVFSGKNAEYPSSLLTAELKKVITSTISSCDNDSLQNFYEQTLITMPTDINRGLNISGTKLVLQLLSFYKPSIVLDNMTRIQETLSTIESRVPASLSLLWVTSQAGVKDARIGVRVWLEAMLPLIGLKNYGGFITQVASQLTPKLKDVKFNNDTVSEADYFSLMDQIQGSTIPAGHKKDISAFVTALTRPVIAASGAKMFAPFLHRLSRETSSSSRSELCRNLADCLKSDDRAFESWRKEYKSNLVASGHLLKWFADHEPKLAKSSDAFRSTLFHFRSMHISWAASGKHPDGLKTCVNLTQSLIGGQTSQRKKKTKSSLFYFNLMLLVALSSLIYYDVSVYGEGCPYRSRVGRFLEQYGVLAKVDDVVLKAQPYVQQLRAKSQPVLDQAAVYGSQAYEKSKPYLDLASVYAVRAKDVASVYAIQLKDIVYQKGEELYPGIWTEAEAKYQALLVQIQEKSDVALQQSSVYASQAKELGVIYFHKSVELGSGYVQSASQMLKQLMEEERVKFALAYTYEMYHKALHAIGICTH